MDIAQVRVCIGDGECVTLDLYQVRCFMYIHKIFIQLYIRIYA